MLYNRIKAEYNEKYKRWVIPYFYTNESLMWDVAHGDPVRIGALS
jgi:hypothetical protein